MKNDSGLTIALEDDHKYQVTDTAHPDITGPVFNKADGIEMFETEEEQNNILSLQANKFLEDLVRLHDSVKSKNWREVRGQTSHLKGNAQFLAAKVLFNALLDLLKQIPREQPELVNEYEATILQIKVLHAAKYVKQELDKFKNKEPDIKLIES